MRQSAILAHHGAFRGSGTRLPLLGALLCVPLFADPALAQQARDNFDYHSSTSELLGRGTQALTLCSGVFISNRSVDQIYAVEFTGLGAGELTPRSQVQIDDRLKVVTVGGGEDERSPAMRAAYREGVGCVVMAPHQGPDQIQELPEVRMPTLPGVAADIPWPDGDLLSGKPLPAHVNQTALDRAGDWAFDRVGHGGHDGQVTISLLVIHGGEIVYERYAPGFTKDTRTRTWSTAKSITSTILGVAVGEGHLSLDAPLPFTWNPNGAADAPDPRRSITLRNVLHMSSGLYPIDNDYADAVGSQLAYFGGWDSAYFARDRGLVREPGTTMDYENYDSLLALLALRVALGDQDRYLEYPRRALFDRIGMRTTLPGVDRFGNYLLSSHLYTNARDLGRLGILYLNRGKWNGEQVLSEEWVDFVRTPAPSTRQSGNDYGGHFWLVPDRRTDLPQDAYATSGARGQFTIIVPSYDLVIVRRGLDERRGRSGLDSWDLLAKVLEGFPQGSGGAKGGSGAAR